jgi:hypothetical protein
MKTVRQIALILITLVIIACTWISPMDEPAKVHIDAGLKRALVSFASARALSGVLSVVQAAQLDIQPAGIGVTLSPGQLLAPANELVKHFADLMLLACVAFGIQKVLISISGYWLISIALSAVALAWAACQIRQNHAPRWLSRAFLLILMLRFAIPVAMLGTDVLSQKFLAEDYARAQAAIDTTALEASKVKTQEPPPNTASGWLPKLPDWVPSIPEVQARYSKLKQTVEQSTEQMIMLMVVFLLQTLVLPLLLIGGLFAMAKGGITVAGNPLK